MRRLLVPFLAVGAGLYAIPAEASTAFGFFAVAAVLAFWIWEI